MPPRTKKIVVPRPIPVEVIPPTVMEDIVPEKEEESVPESIDGEGNVISGIKQALEQCKYRKVGIFPPKSRALLKMVGNEKVKSVILERSPISVGRVINWMTLGYYDKSVQKTQYPHDKMFHLRIILNTKYILEKNQVPNFQVGKSSMYKELINVKLPRDFEMTIQEFIDNQIKYMGAKKWSCYDAKFNNCQIFVKDALKANKLMTPEYNKFVVQNVNAFFKKYPKTVEKIVKKITNLAAKVDRMMEGEGEGKKKQMEQTLTTE